MTKAKAEKLGAALVACGLLESATPGSGAAAKASAAVQGAATIDGYWTGRAAHASIMCEHVAEALIAAGRWTPEAIRACRHEFKAGSGYVQWSIPYRRSDGSWKEAAL